MKTLTVTFSDGDTLTLDENSLEGLEFTCLRSLPHFIKGQEYRVEETLSGSGTYKVKILSQLNLFVVVSGAEIIAGVDLRHLHINSYIPPNKQEINQVTNTPLSNHLPIDDAEEIRKQSAFFFGRTWSGGVR